MIPNQPICPDCGKPYVFGTGTCPCGRLLESMEAGHVHLDALPELDAHGPPPPPPVVRLFLSVDGEPVMFMGALAGRIPVGEKPIAIGRRDPMAGHYPEVDLQDLSDYGYASRRHAEVVLRGGRVFVTDVKGAGTTAINEITNVLPPNKPVEVAPGGRVIIGERVIFVVVREEERSL